MHAAPLKLYRTQREWKSRLRLFSPAVTEYLRPSIYKAKTFIWLLDLEVRMSKKMDPASSCPDLGQAFLLHHDVMEVITWHF